MMSDKHFIIGKSIVNSGKMDDDLENKLKEAIDECKIAFRERII